MTTVNRRGAYMAFEHDRPEDWRWLAAWQPSVVRLMLNGSHTDPASVSVDRIRRVHQTVPGALILLRCWDVDDRRQEAHQEMAADPLGFARRQVDWWLAVVDGIDDVPLDQLMAGLNNEVNVDQYGAQLFSYTMAAMAYASRNGLRLGVGMFSVGTPGKPGEAQYDMAYFSAWEDAIVAGEHALVLHEYMQPEGMYAVWTDKDGNERRDWQNLINRHVHWPMKRAKKIIGEWGVEGLLFNRHRHPEYGHNGWRNFPEWPATRIADEYVTCCQVADPSVLAICQFIVDAPDRTWHSFDPLPAYDALLARRHLCEVEVDAAPTETVYIPVVNHMVDNQPVQPTPQTPAPDDRWQRSYAFVRRWEGGLSLDPNDPGNYYNGQLVGTKYGISAAVWGGLYDIPNLTEAQAEAIYQQHYWQASGADKLPWPLCLFHFDTAVNAGVGQARTILDESGGNPWAYMGHLLDWYTRIPSFERFGKAWVRRRAELLVEAAA